MMRSLVMLGFLCTTRIGGAAVIQAGYMYHQEARGFLKLHRGPQPWDSARIRCHDEGAVLASPLHAGLLATIKELQALEPLALPMLLSGVHATFGTGLYYSVDGVPLKDMSIPWASGVDHLHLERLERCLVYYADGSMGDQACDKALPFFCFAELSMCEPGGRKKSLPTGVTLADYELDGRTGSGYKFHTQALTWDNAYRTCAQEGAHLAVINSPTEAAVLSELFGRHPSGTIQGTALTEVVAVGFHSWQQTGSWWTIHGKTLNEAGYSRWGGGEPNSAAQGGGMFRDGSLDDLNPTFKVPFICEKTPMWWPGRQ